MTHSAEESSVEPVTSEDRTGFTASFPLTHWSVVLAAGGADLPHATAALEELCRTYWYPLYAFARRLGHAPPEAEDLTQAFFQHLLESKWVRKVAPAGGKFRSVLLVSFNNFLADQRDRAGARKRGGDRTFLPLDTQAAETRIAQELASAPPPEAFYDRSWARATVNQALQRMEGEFAASSRLELFQTLKSFLQGDAQGPAYAEVALGLGTTEGTIKVTVSRMRQRYRELLRATIAQTVTNPAEVDGEMRHLLAALLAR